MLGVKWWCQVVVLAGGLRPGRGRPKPRKHSPWEARKKKVRLERREHSASSSVAVSIVSVGTGGLVKKTCLRDTSVCMPDIVMTTGSTTSSGSIKLSSFTRCVGTYNTHIFIHFFFFRPSIRGHPPN